MKGRNFIYLACLSVGAAVMAWGAFLYLDPSKETASSKAIENVSEKASADVLPGCGSVSAGGRATNAAVETLDPAGAPDVERADFFARCTIQEIGGIETARAHAGRVGPNAERSRICAQGRW